MSFQMPDMQAMGGKPGHRHYSYSRMVDVINKVRVSSVFKRRGCVVCRARVAADEAFLEAFEPDEPEPDDDQDEFYHAEDEDEGE